jgi:hypothetical protein
MKLKMKPREDGSAPKPAATKGAKGAKPAAGGAKPAPAGAKPDAPESAPAEKKESK